MAAAPLLRRHILPLAGLTTALTLYPKRSISAEEAPSDPIKDLRSRKPIYSHPTQPAIPSSHAIAASTPPPASGITSLPQDEQEEGGGGGEAGPRSPTPTDRLASQIKKTRLHLHTYALRAEDRLNSGMDRIMHAENTFTSTIASLAPPKESNEKLLPGSIYVLVAAMAGSIISRNRNIFLRFLTPVVTGVTAAHYLVPRTTRNVGDLVWRYEERFPVVRDNHLRVREGVRHFVETGRAHSQRGLAVAEERVKGVRETVEEWVRKGR